MSEEKAHECSGSQKLVFACSGAVDVGEIADKAARKMAKEGAGKMFCTAGIGGRVGGILKTTEEASDILAIDGCPLNCVKNSLEKAGFSEFKHLQLADLGLEKGKSPASSENVEKVTAKGAQILQ